MAVGKSEVKVTILGDTKPFEKAVGGLSGKMKGLLGGLGAGVGVAALGKGLINVSKQFQETALAANDFATATGLSVDQASRAIEVAGDLGVEANSLKTAFGRLSKQLGKSEDKFKDYGVVIRKNADGSTDLQATMLNAIDILRETEDPLKRAQIGSELFGKSWADLAPLIELGADEVGELMENVGAGQAITEKEVESAKKLRDSFDSFNDSVSTLKMNLAAGLAPAMSSIASWLSTLNPTTVAWVVGVLGAGLAVAKLSTAIGGVTQAFTLLAANPWVLIIAGIAAAVLLLATNWDKVTAAAKAAAAAIRDAGSAFVGWLPGGNWLANKFAPKPVGLKEPRYEDGTKVQQRATGGPVLSGSPYIVGEDGPEWFVPGRNGTIIPNGAGGMSIGVVNVYGVTDLRSFQVQLERETARQRRGAA